MKTVTRRWVAILSGEGYLFFLSLYKEYFSSQLAGQLLTQLYPSKWLSTDISTYFLAKFDPKINTNCRTTPHKHRPQTLAILGRSGTPVYMHIHVCLGKCVCVCDWDKGYIALCTVWPVVHVHHPCLSPHLSLSVCVYASPSSCSLSLKNC